MRQQPESTINTPREVYKQELSKTMPYAKV